MNNSAHDKIEKELAWNNVAKPDKLPSPTYYPFFLALGVTFLLWGFLSHWLISIAGLITISIALIGWIKALRHEETE